MKIKRYLQFVSEEVDIEGTYLQNKSSSNRSSEEQIHRKRFGNVFRSAINTTDIDWGIEFENTGGNHYKIIFKEEFFQHFEKAAKTDSRTERSKWIEELKKDFLDIAEIRTEGIGDFNRTHFPGGIPRKLFGLGLGYIIYEGLIKHLGYASSKSNASDLAQGVWSKIAGDLDFLGIICDESIIVFYKPKLDESSSEIMLNFLDENLDENTVEELKIDTEIFEIYPEVQNHVESYKEVSKNRVLIEKLLDKITKISRTLNEKFSKNTKEAKVYFESVKQECEQYESEIKKLSRRHNIQSLETVYFYLLKNKLENLSSKLQPRNKNLDFSEIENIYKNIKEEELDILNNLPEFSESTQENIKKLKTPTSTYKQIKFENIKSKFLMKFNLVSFSELQDRMKQIQPELEEFKDLEIYTKYLIPDLLNTYYPESDVNFYKNSTRPISVEEFFNTQLKIGKTLEDIKLFDKIYKDMYREFEIRGYKKVAELYEKELKSQIEKIPQVFKLDLTWCQNTLRKHFKNKDNFILKTPVEILNLLLEIMKKIEEDRKITIEKKAYKKFTDELEIAFKSGGYEKAQQLYDTEIEKRADLLGSIFFDDPNYGTSTDNKNHTKLTGKEHLSKRMEIYKKLGQFPKITNPTIKNPEPKSPEPKSPEPKSPEPKSPEPKSQPISINTNQERPKVVEPPKERTFIQKFRDFLGI